MRLPMPLLSFVLVAAAVAFGAAGCKQGEGDRCEFQNDCSGGLTCDTTKMVCVGADVTPVDAAPPRPTVREAAAPLDVEPVDASVTVDAQPESSVADGGDSAVSRGPDL